MTQERFQNAPFFADVAEGPAGGEAFWVPTSDGVRIRVGVWPTGAKGTVLLFPGRTEYIEKYGRAAGDLALRGYSTITVDWRGQGLADRPLANRVIGHVGSFSEYQLDVQAVIGAAKGLRLPEPFFLVAHSMGGCIGLRALINGLDVRSAAFSAPMWGILMPVWKRMVATVLGHVSGWTGTERRMAPGTSAKSYIADVAFAENVLTTDPEMWRYMHRQIVAHPELSLAGPSLAWLHEAMIECNRLALAPSPDLPVLTALGTAEKVVDPAQIHKRMARWPKGRLDLYEGAEHEVIMETPDRRKRFFDAAAALFQETA